MEIVVETGQTDEYSLIRVFNMFSSEIRSMSHIYGIYYIINYYKEDDDYNSKCIASIPCMYYNLKLFK